MEELPPRVANVRVDVSSFDVPIVKLDEWMEGSSDEIADEWFLRPQIKVDESDSDDSLAPLEPGSDRGRSRRRRRRGNGAPERGEVVKVVVDTRDEEEDPMGMNVVFRKRD